ncbi:hypothetical protein NBO_52g0005 [Nosema bombycis CQ1]|uniref:Uncharacterized protein n=1 Tax=Nosema bombycis (strain CQ1 / CVCC 102059) TaxID=578461 RepID=R0M7F8_NOSB1|nr:hypothetical protein NBO_52g0005 [Nosema bombycis CQ1]|eukprot:EOB13914.1 hypothetical protein NBO_52g0005 [Nosema bombycis CQ1]
MDLSLRDIFYLLDMKNLPKRFDFEIAFSLETINKNRLPLIISQALEDLISRKYYLPDKIILIEITSL